MPLKYMGKLTNGLNKNEYVLYILTQISESWLYLCYGQLIDTSEPAVALQLSWLLKTSPKCHVYISEAD